jgi:hypothetical protein
VIALPSMVLMMAAMWYLFTQISKLTGEDIDNFLQ